MVRTQRTFGARAPRRLALGLAATLVMVLGLCPALTLAEEIELEPEGTEEPAVALAEEIELEPEGTEEPAVALAEEMEVEHEGGEVPVVALGEEIEVEPEGLPVEDVEVIAQDLSAQTIDVDYLDVDGSVRTVNAEVITNQSSWGKTGEVTWYVVTGNPTINDYIAVVGDVHLILADGARLIANRGILLNLGKSLTIYAQSTDKNSMGKLEATYTPEDEHEVGSGITGQYLTINGGMVTFTGWKIDGIYLCVNGTSRTWDASLTINGGEVKAVGGIQVLGGKTPNNDPIDANLTINGGTVTTNGKYYGISARDYEHSDHTRWGRTHLTITGGEVNATGSTAGIKVDTGNLAITGGKVTSSGPRGIFAEGGVTIGDSVSVKAGEDEKSAIDVTGKAYAEWGEQKWAQTTVPVTVVTVAPASETLTVGDTVTLTATAEPDHAVDKSVTWKSSNTGVATVDEKTGEVIAVGAGTATITATANDGSGKSATCAMTVKAKPEPTPEPTPAKAIKPCTKAHPAAGTIDASWKAAKGAKTYELSWREAGGKWKKKRVKKTGYTIHGLKAGRLYDIRVRAVKGAGKDAWSKVTRRWLRSATKVRAATGKTKGSVRVTWEKDKKATGGYKVYVYAKRDGKLVTTEVVSTSKASATIKGLKSGKAYYVRVRPYRTRGGATYVGTISGYRSAKAK